MRRAAAALGFLFLILTGFLHGQVGSTTDILTGTVTDENGTPIAGAIVEALSLETQITRRTTTDARGRYTILFPDAAGPSEMPPPYPARHPHPPTRPPYPH